jgi:type II secretory pathway pseudopilin PulG
MRLRSKQSGLTLTEMTVVIASIVLLAVIGLPAVRAFVRSFETEAGTRAMISAALSSVRAIAAQNQKYAGIRFQQDTHGHQYMIFIIQDPDMMAWGFRAAPGLKPVKLPDSIGVMDLIVRTNHGTSSSAAEDTGCGPLVAEYLDDANPLNLGPDGKNKYVTDTCSFSIIFSPAGKLVTHDVRVRNKDGVYQPNNGGPASKRSMDDIFNSEYNIKNYGVGLFIQDDYAELGLGAESSRYSFIIYDKSQFNKLNANGRFSYLSGLKPIYINSYTGTIVNNQQ